MSHRHLYFLLHLQHIRNHETGCGSDIRPQAESELLTHSYIYRCPICSWGAARLGVLDTTKPALVTPSLPDDLACYFVFSISTSIPMSFAVSAEYIKFVNFLFEAFGLFRHPRHEDDE